MSLAFYQQFALGIVFFSIRILWFVDVVTSFSLRKLLATLRWIFVVGVLGGTTLFLAYSIHTNFLYRIADGYFFGSQNFEYTTYVRPDFPIKVVEKPVPQISATAALVVDNISGKRLYMYNADKILAPASTTKLMTALVALDLYNLDDIVTVPLVCTKIDSTKAWLPVDSRYKVHDLIMSMMVGSAGDSACVLSMGKTSAAEFVNLMNKKAREFGMKDTNFTNPVGLDGPIGEHHSTAADLYVLSQKATANSFIKQAVTQKELDLFSADQKFETKMMNTNSLLWQVPGTVGIKTGTTASAGEVLIYEYADDKKDLTIIVMGSTDRFYDTRALLEWAQSSYSWE